MLKHKFRAKPTDYNGIRYASKKEAAYAAKLDMLKKAGEILFYIRQVPFDLPGNSRHRVDFMEFWANGTVVLTEVKGMDLPQGKMCRKQVEDLYGVEIAVV